MLLGTDDDHQVGDESASNKAPIYHHVGEDDEPTVTSSGFQFTGRFSTGDRTGWIFTSNTNSNEKSIGGEGGEETLRRASSTIGSCCERSEDGKNDGRNQERTLARPLIGCVTEHQLANNCTSEGNGGDILLCG